MLQCNIISHWLSPYPEWSLCTVQPKSYKHSQGCGAISCSEWRITPVKTYTVKYFQVIILVTNLAINQIDLLHKHHNAPVPYPTLWDICIMHCGVCNIVILGINSLRPSDAYMRQWSNHQMVQIMACRRQAIIITHAGILLIRPLGTNFSKILIEILIFSFKKMHLKVPSKRWPFCLGLNVLSTP